MGCNIYHKDLTGDDLHIPKTHTHNHDDLTNISGGAFADYYHMTSTEYTELVDLLGGIVSSGNIITFTNFPLTPSSAPTTDYQVANKKYVDDQIATEDIWDRSAGTITTKNANDNLTIDNDAIINLGYTHINRDLFVANNYQIFMPDTNGFTLGYRNNGGGGYDDLLSARMPSGSGKTCLKVFHTGNYLYPYQMSSHNDYTNPTFLYCCMTGADSFDYGGLLMGGRAQDVSSSWYWDFMALTGSIDSAIDATTTELAPIFRMGATGTATTSHSIGVGSLLLEEDLEVNGDAYFDGSLTIPNGVNPTIDTLGEIAQDSTDYAWLGWDGSARAVFAHPEITVTKHIYYSGNDWEQEEVCLFVAPRAMNATIKEVRATVVGDSGSSLTYNLEERTWSNYDQTGVDVFSTDQVATVNGDIENGDDSATLFDNDDIEKNAGVFFVTTTGAESGTVNSIIITITYVRNVE